MMQKIIIAMLFALPFLSTANADHKSHITGPDGQWLAVFSLVAGSAGCPIYVEIPTTFSKSKLSGTNADIGNTIHGVIDDHGKITGHIWTPEGYPDFDAQFDGSKFIGIWTAVGHCDGIGNNN
jgi:hypothetical protein